MKILIHIIKHFFNFSAILPNWIGKQTEKKYKSGGPDYNFGRIMIVTEVIRVSVSLVIVLITFERCYRTTQDYLSSPTGIIIYQDYLSNQELPQ